MKRFLQYIVYLFAAGMANLVSRIPRKWVLPMARVFARLLYLSPQIGKVSMQNIAVVFPEKGKRERKRLVMESLAHMIRVEYEFFRMKRLKNTPNELVLSVGDTDKNMQEAIENMKSGGFFITPHHGNWEFAGKILNTRYHIPMSTIVRSPQNPYIGKMLAAGRENPPEIELIQSKGAAKAILNALKRNRGIGILMDQNVKGRDGGVFVEFFGLPVPVTVLPAHMVRMRNLPVLTGGVYYEGEQAVFEAIKVENPAGYPSDEALTRELMRVQEAFIRKHPEQYLWMYKRFQYIPENASEELKAKYPAYATVVKPAFYDSRLRSKRK